MKNIILAVLLATMLLIVGCGQVDEAPEEIIEVEDVVENVTEEVVNVTEEVVENITEEVIDVAEEVVENVTEEVIEE